MMGQNGGPSLGGGYPRGPRGRAQGVGILDTQLVTSQGEIKLPFWLASGRPSAPCLPAPPGHAGSFLCPELQTVILSGP